MKKNNNNDDAMKINIVTAFLSHIGASTSMGKKDKDDYNKKKL